MAILIAPIANADTSITKPTTQPLAQIENLLKPPAPKPVPNFDKEVIEPLRAWQKKVADCEAAGGSYKKENCELPPPVVVATPVYFAPTPVAAQPQSTYRPMVSIAGNGYSYGYCTYHVKNRRPDIPNNWGNAGGWFYAAQRSGYAVGYTPRPGAIAEAGGHVAYVESVSGGSVTVSEMNWNGNWNKVTYRTAPAGSFRYIY